MTSNDKPREMKVWLGVRARFVPVLIVLAAACVVLLLATVLPKTSREKPAKPAPPVNVQVIRVEQGPEIETIELPGRIEPNRVVTLSAEVAGRAEKPPVLKGQIVGEGQEILQLNDELIKPDYDRAKAANEYWKKHYLRIEDSKEQNVATDRDLEEAEMRRAAAQADSDVAEARWDRTTICSPIAGVLDKLYVEEGQSVKLGDPVADIVEVDPLIVVVDVPEADLPYIRQQRNQDVNVLLREPLPQDVTGKITYIAERADPQTRTTRVEIEVPNPLQAEAPGQPVRKLHSGPIATVKLIRRKHPDAILIPLQAVIPLAQGHAVYVVVDGKAERRMVKQGFMKGWKMQVLPPDGPDNPGETLKPGDLLIIKGHHYVSPGQAVRIEQEQSPAASTQPAGDEGAQP